jgi:hypothetical protein
MIAPCMHNDLHATGNGSLSSAKAPAPPHPRTAPTIYAIPELEAALVCREPARLSCETAPGHRLPTQWARPSSA